MGSDPRDPPGPIAAFATLRGAYQQARRGFSDWVLLRRGDAWEDPSEFPLHLPDGQSAAAPSLLGAYGKGCTRPVLRTGLSRGLELVHGYKFVAIAGIEIYAHERDPAYTGRAKLNTSQVQDLAGVYVYGGNDAGPVNLGLLLDDCFIHFYQTNIIFTGAGPYNDTVIRRCVISDAYGFAPTAGKEPAERSQGMFGGNLHGLLLEDNTFDHNGWLELPNDPLTRAVGATMFNHNTYVEGSELTFRNNFFLRASSGGNKFRSDTTGGMRNTRVEGNLYVEGE